MKRLIIIALSLALIAPSAIACTTFCSRGVFGRNYDFETHYGMLMVNKRGMQKRSITSSGAAWTSRYGSVTFNQFGRDFPMDGMNEAGLVVALMWLDGTRYPTADERPTVGVLEWIQYQLDMATTVDDVIANCSRIRITERGTPLHYLVADKTGAVASIEFLGGALVVHRDTALRVPVLTNDTYSSSLAYFDRVRRDNRTATSASSLDRFARAAMMLQNDAGTDPVEHTLATLAAVAQPGGTRWSVAYDTRDLSIHYRTANNPARRTLRMGSFDMGCGTAVRILDVDEGAADVTAAFSDYTFARNHDLVRASYKSTSFLRDTPDDELEETARHPERARCDGAPRRRSVR